MVRVDDLPIALLGFLAFVVMSPIWIRFLNGFTASKPEDAFMAAMVLPAVAALFIVSWISTELSRVLLGAFMLIGVMLMAPWFWRFSDMVSSQLTSSPLTQFLLQLAIPVLVLTFLVQIGQRRLLPQ